MARSKAKALSVKSTEATDPFKLRSPREEARAPHEHVHLIRKGVRCDTERRGYDTPRSRSPFEIAVDASEGFIPLWAKDTTLRWRFRDSSFQEFEDHDAAKAAVEQLMAEAILAWGDAAPVKFTRRDDAWDFEIVMREADNCDISGCVLASAFFPDAGRHKLVLYPKMFTQDREEQVETLIHEIGHIFGLRHFFALMDESAWPAVIFGEHQRFSIMNYGADSELSANDTADLKSLYQLAWAGQLTHINGTPIRFVRPFHDSGIPAENMVSVAPGSAKLLSFGL
ncbi:hypothetical protein GGQ64_004596 [Rhizobium azooxidifex]|uniref:Peptidase metallopeptidase domain-containing protein n=1 Tax=Mycoplana azooxidifex TaxID=1636188 RepID=A0A7W6D9W2_9HYPH|nr:matrixin family metalloprotease [Mycoplana azooxidifex]MBB3979356.1 hypothetical protein [Mycoplana azooxidifex]